MGGKLCGEGCQDYIVSGVVDRLICLGSFCCGVEG